MPFNNFTDNVDNFEDIVVEDFIDGTMINVFHHKEAWHIATRSRIGANCRWFSNKNFSDMFEDAKGSLNFNELNPENTYTLFCVIQKIGW